MNDKQLQKLVEQLSIEFFGRPFIHRARFNPRLKTTGGRYFLHSHDVELNPKQYEIHGKDALIAIIKHELCHYHLHLENKGFKHRDRDFKELLAQVGGARYCQVIEGTRRKEMVKYIYRCTNCSHLYRRKRRVNITKYVCGKCRGKLVKCASIS